MATTAPMGRGVRGENSAKTVVTDQISESLLSTCNLIHVMLQSSTSQENLLKLPKKLLSKASTINNTKHVLHQMPFVISSLDAHMDHVLQTAPYLETVTRLLTNLQTTQLNPLAHSTHTQEREQELKPDTSN